MPAVKIGWYVTDNFHFDRVSRVAHAKLLNFFKNFKNKFAKTIDD